MRFISQACTPAPDVGTAGRKCMFQGHGNTSQTQNLKPKMLSCNFSSDRGLQQWKDGIRQWEEEVNQQSLAGMIDGRGA